MKTHAKNAALGGGIVPVILAAAAAIANASQQALNLNLQGIALAIYLVGFVIAAAVVVGISLKVEGQKAIADLTTPKGSPTSPVSPSSSAWVTCSAAPRRGCSGGSDVPSIRRAPDRDDRAAGTAHRRG